MAKRFINTNVWKEQLLRGLPGAYKLLWLYINSDCDHAGIWICDFEIASVRIGFDVIEAEAKRLFADKIIIIENGEKWFVPSFIEEQYDGKLKSNNLAHRNVIKVLQKYNLLGNYLVTEEPLKELHSPSEGAKEKEKAKEEEEEKEKQGVQGDFLSTATEILQNLDQKQLPRHPHWPVDENECGQFFKNNGSVESEGIRFFHKYEAQNWLTAGVNGERGSPIVRWRSKAKEWIMNPDKFKEDKKPVNSKILDESKYASIPTTSNRKPAAI